MHISRGLRRDEGRKEMENNRIFMRSLTSERVFITRVLNGELIEILPLHRTNLMRVNDQIFAVCSNLVDREKNNGLVF